MRCARQSDCFNVRASFRRSPFQWLTSGNSPRTVQAAAEARARELEVQLVEASVTQAPAAQALPESAEVRLRGQENMCVL